MAELLKGKRGLITGIANNRSIAWGIAEAMKAEGAELAFGVQMDVFGEKVKPLAAELGVDLVLITTFKMTPVPKRRLTHWPNNGAALILRCTQLPIPTRMS